MLLWLSSVTLLGNKFKHSQVEILATGVAVYLDSKLRKLKSQTYQSDSAAKVREKLPAIVQHRENRVWSEGKLPSLAENFSQKRGRTTFPNVRILDDRNSSNQILGLLTSIALQNYLFW